MWEFVLFRSEKRKPDENNSIVKSAWMKIKMYSRSCLHHFSSNIAHCANINTSHALHSILLQYRYCIYIKIVSISISYKFQYCINIIIVFVPISIQVMPTLYIVSISILCRFLYFLSAKVIIFRQRRTRLWPFFQLFCTKVSSR